MPASSASGTGATVHGASGTVANHLGASASAAATTRRACSSISSRFWYRKRRVVGQAVEDLGARRSCRRGGIPSRRSPRAPARRSRGPWHAARRGSSSWTCAAGPWPGTSPPRRAGSRCRGGRRRGPPGAPRCAARPGRRPGPVGRARRWRPRPPRRRHRRPRVRAMAPERGILDHEVELGDGGLDEPGHRRAAGSGTLLVTPGHRGEHARQAAQPGEVPLAPLLGVERDLGQRGQHGCRPARRTCR